MSTPTKKVMISGLAFDFNHFKPDHWLSFLNSGERADMQKLQHLAKQGWIVTQFKSLYYLCEKQEPANIQYAIDYRKNVDEEYFEIFHMAGWKYVGSVEYIHLFKADENNAPLLTDLETRIDVAKQEMKRFFRYSVFTILVFFYLNTVINYALNIENTLLTIIMIILLILSLISVVFTFLPLLGYFSRVLKLKKQRI
jgi:hypothetical protein